MDVTASSSKDTITEVPKLNEEQAKQKDKCAVQKKIALPPEYDENDSRWTLKYRETAPGLVELIKHSGVYVNADKLAECQKWSNDCKTFARMLLTEIFTTSALSTCLWSSATTNASHIDGGHARPGLDEHARNILLTFVVEYGQIRDWIRTDYQCILKGIRQIMLEMRRKNEAVEEKSDVEPLQKKSPHERQSVFPQEYDKNNSRWTVKYREYAPGLVELMEDSCVYVEASKLAKCKRLSNDCITLARMLLAEMFSKSALSTCSVTAVKATNFYHDGSNTRPGLDEKVMKTLLKFVAEYGLDKDWIVTGHKRIQHSIQQKLEVLRRVERQEVEAEHGDEPKKKIVLRPKRKYITPDYDGNDSRWTLKYREPAAGLVELIKRSGVYVNAEKLAECKRLSNDCVTLAKMLLTEIFTTSALSICSFSKKNCECYKTYRRYRRAGGAPRERLQPSNRPELDAHAEIILLNFVDEYALEKGWEILDFRLIKRSIIHKMHVMRDEKRKFRQAGRNEIFFPL